MIGYVFIAAFDLEAIFSESLPDDFVFFTQTFANMDQTAFQKFIDSPQLVQPEDLQDVSLSVLSAMNVSMSNMHIVPYQP